MSRVRAPGKVMLAGEYAVLHGAPAAVLAVDRYAYAQVRDMAPAFEPPEALAAMELAREEGLLESVPHVEVQLADLNRDGRKLGLGSSAAGCVAALGAALASQGRSLEEHRGELARLARRGHQRSQGGGSGVDVLASAWGGLTRVQLAQGPEGDALARPLAWPEGVWWSVLWTGVAVKTSELLAAVRALGERNPSLHAERMGALAGAAERLVGCFERGDGRTLVDAVRAQHRAMEALGEAAGREIVTGPMRQLDEALRPFSAAVKPSGAGGGDVVLLVGHSAHEANETKRLARSFGFTVLELEMDLGGARVAP